MIALALIGDLAFVRVTEFPATVPVAVAVVAVEIWSRRGRCTVRRAAAETRPAERDAWTPGPER